MAFRMQQVLERVTKELSLLYIDWHDQVVYSRAERKCNQQLEDECKRRRLLDKTEREVEEACNAVF